MDLDAVAQESGGSVSRAPSKAKDRVSVTDAVGNERHLDVVADDAGSFIHFEAARVGAVPARGLGALGVGRVILFRHRRRSRRMNWTETCPDSV